MQNIYNDLGITENNLDNADKSAIATISRLSYIYNTEVRGRKFIGKNGQNIDSNALLSVYPSSIYCFQGYSKYVSYRSLNTVGQR